MVSDLAKQRAAQAWCFTTTKHIPMNVELADAFATILEDIWTKPWLGNATTADLLNELRARAEMQGLLHYKSVSQPGEVTGG